MSEIERMRALARYACERDRLPVEELASNARRTSCAVPGKPRRARWRRWLVRSLLSGLIIDTALVGTDRSLNVGLYGSDYASFALIGALLYAALALALLARWVWRLDEARVLTK
jgi:hypothetical protein